MIPNRSCEVSPLVVPADRVADILLTPRNPADAFCPSRRYEVEHYAAESKGRSAWPAPCECRVQDGALAVRFHAFSEQEHVLRVLEQPGAEPKFLMEVRVYSVADDLFRRHPFKGDLHIHSNRSDGREPPAVVAAACREIGLDFMAVTDHGRYEPSVEAQQAFADVPTDLQIFRGEEVHPPGNAVHLINFCGSFSVNDLMKGPHEAAYRAEVRTFEAALRDLPPEASRYEVASCLWCFDKIRQGGGLGIFCHPYWYQGSRYHIHSEVNRYLLEKRPFDAFELIGGFHRHEEESNLLQVARYHDERCRGGDMAIVGSSDAHGVRCGTLFGWYYTITFAQSEAWTDLKESIVGHYSVAVEALPNEWPRAHGPFRLVKLAQFLIREFFPRLDALCVAEGQALLAHAEGDVSAAGRLVALQGQTQRLRSQLWRRP